MRTLSKLIVALLIAVSFLTPGAILAGSFQPAPQQPSSALPPTTGNQPDSPTKSHQPRPNPDASGRYHIGDGVTAPVLIHSVEPEAARGMSRGDIKKCPLVALTVDTDGKPTDVHVILPTSKTDNTSDESLDPMIEAYCIAPVKQYRFKPGLFQGKPVPVDLRVEVFINKF